METKFGGDEDERVALDARGEEQEMGVDLVQSPCELGENSMEEGTNLDDAKLSRQLVQRILDITLAHDTKCRTALTAVVRSIW